MPRRHRCGFRQREAVVVNVAHSWQDYPRFQTVGGPSTYVSVATTPPTTTNGNASKRTPIAVAIARYAFTQSPTLSPARSEAATLFDRHLERGIRLGLDRGTPPLDFDLPEDCCCT